jgi:release factor glutamine methyltransferase
LIARRGRGEPVAYLVGRKEFMGLAFEVDSNVLIPRPDSELLVEKVSECIGEGEALVLDIGCGSGCLLLSIMNRCPRCRGVGVDISQGALAVTRRNAEAWNYRPD